MARKPQVTRTIITTKAVIMCVDTKDGKTFRNEVTLPRTYKSDQAILKASKDVLEDEGIKVVHVVSSETHETLYGMSEADFIKYAQILPPRNDTAQEAESEAQTGESETNE